MPDGRSGSGQEPVAQAHCAHRAPWHLHQRQGELVLCVCVCAVCVCVCVCVLACLSAFPVSHPRDNKGSSGVGLTAAVLKGLCSLSSSWFDARCSLPPAASPVQLDVACPSVVGVYGVGRGGPWSVVVLSHEHKDPAGVVAVLVECGGLRRVVSR